MIYFDNSATTGTKPDCVIDAVTDAMKNLSANPGRSGHSAALRAGLKILQARKSAASLVGCKSERVIFCGGCTQALNYAIFGTLVRGGNVVTTAYEHNSVLRPLFELQRMGIITVTVLRPGKGGYVDAERVRRVLSPKTYLVAINAVSNVTGAVTPVREIGKLCRERGILTLVDGAQGVGYGDYSMVDDFIDLLALAPHKGLHAPQGVGVLAIGENVSIQPVICGGTGTQSESVFQPKELPESLESGTLPTPLIAGLEAAIKWTESVRESGRRKLSELSKFLITELRKTDGITMYTPPETYNGIVAFNVRDYGSAEIGTILSDQYDIAVRGGLHCAPLIHRHLGTLKQGIVRASLSYENTFEETEFFLRAVREIAH